MQYNVGPFAQILMLPTDLLRGKFPYFFLSNLKHVISSIILHRVCKSEISPVPSLLWPVPIKSHLSKKPPLPPCLPSLPLLPLGSFFCLPLLIFSPWSLTPPPLQLSLFQLQWRGLLSAQSEEDDWKRTSKKEKGGVKEHKKGCTAAQMEKELPSQRKGRELSSRGFEATLRGRRKRAERGLSGEDVTGLFLPRVMQTTFYHLEKQARGRRGGGGK